MPPRLPDLNYHPPLEPYLSILYQDDDILVLDKPSGLLTVPGSHPALKDSLISRVRKTFPKAQLINRLDRATSGIVLVGLTKQACSFIGSQFENKATKKLYQAIVFGHLPDDAGFIDLPLASDPENKPCHCVNHETGRPSQTEWQVVERLPSGATRVHLIPLTGRTHQLRVHMKAIGYPILGDKFYAEGEALVGQTRLLLHAEKLSFTHPNGESLTVISPCPF